MLRHLILVMLSVLTACPAYAVTGSSGHIWEETLFILQESITGPAGQSIALIAIAIAGFAWLFGSHQRGMQNLLALAVGLGMVLASASVLASLGFPGATF